MSAIGWIPRGIILGLVAFAIFGPLANLALWAAAEQWYFPFKLPVVYGLKFWYQVFKPSSDALKSLGTSVVIALLTVAVSLALAIPAGYALARLSLPFRGLIIAGSVAAAICYLLTIPGIVRRHGQLGPADDPLASDVGGGR